MRFLWINSLIIITFLVIIIDGVPNEKEGKNEHEPGNENGGVQKEVQNQERRNRRGRISYIRRNKNRNSVYRVIQNNRARQTGNSNLYQYQQKYRNRGRPVYYRSQNSKSNRQTRRRAWRKPRIPQRDNEKEENSGKSGTNGGSNKSGGSSGTSSGVSGGGKEKEQREWTKPKVPRPKRFRTKKRTSHNRQNNYQQSPAWDKNRRFPSRDQVNTNGQQKTQRSSWWNRYMQYKRWYWQMQRRKTQTMGQGSYRRRHVGMTSKNVPRWRYYNRRPMRTRNKQKVKTDNGSD